MIRWDSGNIPEDRPSREIITHKVEIEEFPTRITHKLRNNRERDKFIKTCEAYIRKSREYTRYVKFLKANMDMNHCAVLPKIVQGNGKKYSIDIHHEPFELYKIVDLEIMRREAEEEPLTISEIAKVVVRMHYEGIIGLIPLSKTQHELIDAHKVFIPLQHIYQDYHVFFERYQEYIEECDYINDAIETKVRLSMECDQIQSAAAEAKFVYIECGGFEFPQIPEEWLTIFNTDHGTMADAEDRLKKEEAKKAKEEAKKAKLNKKIADV